MSRSVLVLATSVLFVLQAKAAELGAVEIAGNACEVAVGTHELLAVNDHRFVIPTGLYLKKDEDKSIARGQCTFALTLQASPGKKIIVSNSHQLVSLRAYPSGTKVQMNLEIFKAGSRGSVLTAIAQAADQVAKTNQSLESSDSLVETECGGSAILRGNLSATALGAGKARAFARPLYLDITEVTCP